MIATSLLRARLRSFTVFGACLLLVALIGCGDDNPAKPLPVQPQYPPSSTPENVLVHMQIAYTHRDSTGYDSLFDAAYAGASFDPHTMTPITFTKADEERHISALAHSFSISSVSLSFPSGLVRYADGADPPGWATIDMQNMILEINDTPTSYSIVPNGTWQFKFEPTTPSAGSPTDTTWHIVRWTEF